MKRIVHLARIRGQQSLQGYIRIAAFSAALLIAPTLQAENLADIYAKAQRNDPAIREAEANMLATRQQLPQARASLLPQLDFNGRFQARTTDGITSNEFQDAREQENDSDSLSWSLDLNQTIFNGDQWRRLKQTDKTVAQADVDYQVARQDLIIRSAETYFNVLAAQDTLLSERARKEAIGRQLEQANRRFEVGLIAITDVKESQAAYDDAVALEIAARRALAAAKEALREVIGEYPGQLAIPGENFPLIAPKPEIEQDWVDIALQQNLALESARIGVEITRDNVRIARAGHLPTLSLSASIGNFDQDSDITSFDDMTMMNVTTERNIDQDSKEVSLSFNLPIFASGGVSAAVQEQVYRHRASRENYEKVARSTEREARDAYLGVIAEIARVRALARSVESNQTALEATEAGYDVGTRTTVDVLDARDSLSRAETQYARSKYDYLINVLKLKQAAGILSPTDVDEINQWLDQDKSLDETPGRGGAPDVRMEETVVPSNPDRQNRQD